MYDENDTGIALLIGMRMDGLEETLDHSRGVLERAIDAYIAEYGEDSLAVDAEVAEMFGTLYEPRDAEGIAKYGVQSSERVQVAECLASVSESEARLDELKRMYGFAKKGE